MSWYTGSFIFCFYHITSTDTKETGANSAMNVSFKAEKKEF